MTATGPWLARLAEASEFYPAFPFGLVPVQTWEPIAMDFEGNEEKLGYLVDLARCSGATKERIVGVLHTRTRVPKWMLRTELWRCGLPVRASQVRAVLDPTFLNGEGKPEGKVMPH